MLPAAAAAMPGCCCLYLSASFYFLLATVLTARSLKHYIRGCLILYIIHMYVTIITLYKTDYS